MPPALRPAPLLAQSASVCAGHFHRALLALEAQWTARPPRGAREARRSPRVSPVAPHLSGLLLPPSPDPEMTEHARRRRLHRRAHRDLRAWLFGAPSPVVQLVIDKILALIHQAQFLPDLDLRMVRAVISPDGRMSDFFFGVHSLLEVAAASSSDVNGDDDEEEDEEGGEGEGGDQVAAVVTRLDFSAKTWANVLGYSSAGTASDSFPVGDRLAESLPRMGTLVQLSIPYVAVDKICYLVARHLHLLEEVVLDRTFPGLTDRGVEFLAGLRTHSSPSSYVSFGCWRLRSVSLEVCQEVTEGAVWNLLHRLPQLQHVNYHSPSVAEILLKKCADLDVGGDASPGRRTRPLAVASLAHSPPYGLVASEAALTKLSLVCPNITDLNVVTTDTQAASYSCLPSLTSVTLELEDCFGPGLDRLLLRVGGNLRHLSISCSSDSDSAILPEEADGGQAFQLFNVGLRLARARCHSEKLRRLTIAGCGLVANSLLSKLREEEGQPRPLSGLEELILLSYEDDHPIQTCEGGLLADTLAGAAGLRVLSLEGNFASFLDDDFFLRCWAHGAMRRLEVLDTQGARLQGLTSSTAEAVLRLPRIKEVRFSSWNLAEEEAISLERRMRRGGFDVTFRR